MAKRNFEQRIKRHMGFIAMFLFGGIFFMFLAGSTGNFIVGGQEISAFPKPTVFATADDYAYVYIIRAGVGYNGISISEEEASAIIVAPDGKYITVRPNVDNSANDSILISFPTTQIIAKVKFDGSIENIWGYDQGQCYEIPKDIIKIEGSLVGAAVDGTWTIKNGLNLIKTPAGIQIKIRGKIYDDVSPQYEQIDQCGNGKVAGDPYAHIKIWNWHEQSVSRFDEKVFLLYHSGGVPVPLRSLSQGDVSAVVKIYADSLSFIPGEKDPTKMRFFTPLPPATARVCNLKFNTDLNIDPSQLQTSLSSVIGIDLLVDGKTQTSCVQKTLRAVSSAFSFGFEEGLGQFATSGDVVWGLDSEYSQIGSFSARSGKIGNSQSSQISASMNIATPGVISFSMKISSEQGYDYLRFYIDDIKVDAWSGDGNWREVSYIVPPGTHTFKWSYEKDVSRSVGSDAAWLDDVQVRLIQPTIV